MFEAGRGLRQTQQDRKIDRAERQRDCMCGMLREKVFNNCSSAAR